MYRSHPERDARRDRRPAPGRPGKLTGLDKEEILTVIGFAHRGGTQTRGNGNPLQAFERALSLGATGLETDVLLTRDGIPVLMHTGLSLRRRVRIHDMSLDELPPEVPTLAGLYDRCGTNFELSLDMAAPQAADAVVELVTERGALDRLWMTYWKIPTLREWRRRWPSVKLVFPTIPIGSRRTARAMDDLQNSGMDVLNVYHRFCSHQLVEAGHMRGLKVFAWGLDDIKHIRRTVAQGVDGVYCDNVEAMTRVL
ncbi:MAG: glycerophosphodiester phosphodiesterase [Chloroflexota bacterium]